MNELFRFHLDRAEEEALVHFLTAKAKGPGLEQLIHFFLQRGRYVEVSIRHSLFFEERVGSR